MGLAAPPRAAFRLSTTALAIATALLFAADWGSRLAGDSLLPGAPLDETAHFLTTLLIFWALGPRLNRRFLAPALVASVAIDLDHVPARLGAQWLTAGTPRPYTHSLLTVAAVMLIALVWRRRRNLWLGVAIGLAIHLWRDMGEGSAGVSLLWPFSYHSFQYPHGLYVAVMALFVLVDALRCRGWSRAIQVPA
jgi:inner membrane protein